MGLDDGKTPKSTHLDIRMKPGWRYLEAKKTFVSEDEQTFSPAPDLPSGANIFYMVPALAEADPDSLSSDEQNLARYIQLVFPGKVDLSAYIEIVQQWPCVDEVRLPPQVSPP